MNNRKGRIRNFNSNRPNRSVGMTTEELRSRKTAREGFKRPIKDLRLNLKKKVDKPGPSRAMDARSKLQARRSVEELKEKSSFNIDERKKQQKSSNQIGNRSLSLDSGTIKITAKQSLPPNRSAEIAGKSIVITTKVDSKDKSKAKQRGKPKVRNLKLMGPGEITVTTKAAGGSPKKKKRQYADLSRSEEKRKDEDLDYYQYKKLKEQSKFEEEYLPVRSQKNMTPLAERLDHGPIPEPRGTPVTSTKVTITNLHPSVSRQDIEELFGAVGVLKSCKMLGPGAAEVIYTVKEDAVTAYARYHNRNLDGQPMQCKLSVVQTMATHTTPVSRPLAPLRSPTPSHKILQPTLESYQPPKRAMPAESRPVVFKVKI